MSANNTKSLILNLEIDPLADSFSMQNAVFTVGSALEQQRLAGNLSSSEFSLDSLSLGGELSQVTDDAQMVILAVLRLYQDKVEVDGVQSVASMPHFTDSEPFDSEQVDELCELLQSNIWCE